MATSSDLLYSVLDLVPIQQGGTARDALNRALDLAVQAERLGYHRYWVAEHHSIAGIASSATAVVLGHLAAGTSTIRVGSGGIMLPNHAPLVIAEQFGTLATLFPGRVDLGLGRAPGGDKATAAALRRTLAGGPDSFPQDVVELQQFLGPARPGAAVRAVPGEGTSVPLYLLGSSTFSARLAARLGLPFAFASHFAPDLLEEALELYRKNFEPSAQCRRPHVMVGLNVFAADRKDSADRLFTTLQQMFLNLIRGHPGGMPPPVDSMDGLWSPAEAAYVRKMTSCSVVGDPAGIRQGLAEWLARTGADEIIVTAQIHDHKDRIHSFEIAAAAFQDLNAGRRERPRELTSAG